LLLNLFFLNNIPFAVFYSLPADEQRCDCRRYPNIVIMLKDYVKNRTIAFVSLLIILFVSFMPVSAQQTGDSLLKEATLQNIIQYALQRQPVVEQSLANEKITELQIKSKLADWYPQVNFGYLYQHNFKVQTTIIGGNLVRLGVNNTSAFQFSATQNIFDRDVLLANKTKGSVLQQAKQQTENAKIDVVVSVSKAFYNVLATEQQIKVANENIVRLEKSLKDAQSRYESGIVDKTDYKRATIALNNARALKKASEDALKARTEVLKSLMNYPEQATLTIVYDSAALEKEIDLDTLQQIDYDKRIEYRLLATQKKLLEANLQYNKWSFIPSISANGAYNFNYLNNDFSKLYNQSFPQSYAGISLSFPIFQGGKRKYNIQQAQWNLKRTDMEIAGLENSINAEYHTAVAGYKASLADYLAMKENVLLAQEVYDVISLQYRAGVKTYLEVVTAETDLRTAQINYFNSLYEVLSSKIDVLRSLGDVKY
jgi:outer membrane protein